MPFTGGFQEDHKWQRLLLRIVYSLSQLIVELRSGTLKLQLDPVHLIVILCLNVFVSFLMLMINKRVGIAGFQCHAIQNRSK